MPCNSAYLDATNREVALSQVACLLEELEGKPINRDHWRGYHPAIYNRLENVDSDKLINTLCSKLQALDVTRYSLEMQMWWRDHKLADKTRIELELAKAKNLAEKQAALAKLTQYEKELLGIQT